MSKQITGESCKNVYNEDSYGRNTYKYMNLRAESQTYEQILIILTVPNTIIVTKQQNYVLYVQIHVKYQ